MPADPKPKAGRKRHTPEPMPGLEPRVARLVLALFTLSGVAGLAYELIWTKKLSLIFGVTSGAITTVLAAFMGGLALGSALLGARADRSRRPLAFYGALEIGIGVSAFLLPYALEGVNACYVSLARAMPHGAAAFIALRYLLCFAVLLVPTALMGGTLPAMSRFWVRERERIGAGVGVLYGANTIGGVVGTIAAGFLLLRTLGLADTTRVVVSLNLLIGSVCIWFARSMPALPQEAEATATGRSRAEAEHHAPGWLLLIGFGVAGATSLAYEVLWTRVLIYFTGQTIYAFSTILAVFLIGLAIGSFALARPADRMRDRLTVFGLLELGIGISAAYVLLLIGRLLPLAEKARALLGEGEALPRFVTAFAIMLVPTLLMGAVTPLIIRAYTRDVARLGGRLGVLYAANTVGCVVGSVVAGFGLLAWLGAQRGVLAVAATNTVLGVLALAWGRWRLAAKVALSAASMAALITGMALSWHPRPPILYWSDFLDLHLDVLCYDEGPEASLAVVTNPAGRRELNLNGDTTAAADYDDVVVHKMLGHVPMLLADNPKSALAIGFGLGSTAWSIAQYPIDRVDCVELVPAERTTAPYFATENKSILSDPKFRFIVQDGRNFLLTNTRKYDVISFNAINPSFSPYLYTREFYQLCRSRLSEHGVVCAWVPTNMGRFDTLAATFRSVFPHVTLWYCNTFHAVLIATPQPLKVDLSRLATKMALPAVQADLAEVQLQDPVRLVSTLLLDEAALTEYTRNAQINTDDLPYVEFDTDITTPIGIRNVGEVLKRRSRPWEDVAHATADQRAALKRCWEMFPRLAEGWGRSFIPGDYDRAIQAFGAAIAIDPTDPRPRYLRAMAVGRAYLTQPEQFATAEQRRRAIATIEAGLRPGEMPAERFAARARAALGLLYVEEGDLAKAREQAGLMYRITPQPEEQKMLLAAVGEGR